MTYVICLILIMSPWSVRPFGPRSQCLWSFFKATILESGQDLKKVSKMLCFVVLAALIGFSQCQTYSPICYDPMAMSAAQQKCYSDQGLILHLAADPNNIDHIKQAAKDNAVTSSPDYVCQNRAAYDNAIHCSLQLSLMCTMPGYESYLPSEDNLKQVQNIMCNNLHVLDHDCTYNKTEALIDCGSRKYGEMTVADAMDPYRSTCLAYEHAEECLEEEIHECGQATLELQKQFNQLQKPIICQGSVIGK